MDEHQRREIAKQIRRLRTDRGLSGAALAERVGVGQNTISAIETGASVPSHGTLMRILEALDMEVTTFGLLPRRMANWLSILGPLAERIPDDRIDDTLGQVVQLLAAAARGPSMAPPTASVLANKIGAVVAGDVEVNITPS